MLAAGVALALGGSAFAQEDPAAGMGRFIGMLEQGSQECDARYDPQGMLNLSNSMLASLRRGHRFSEEEIMSQIGSGAGEFEGTAASLGLKVACDSIISAVAWASSFINRHH